MRLDIYVHFVSSKDAEIRDMLTQVLASLNNLTEITMSTQAELAAALEDVRTEVQKIGTETQSLIAKIADLEAALANAGQTTPEVDTALAALKAQVKVVDDLVADAPAP